MATVVITHKNLRYWQDKVRNHLAMQCGSGMSTAEYFRQWFNRDCTLEFPLGELARDGLTALALVGMNRPEPQPLTGREGFDAQGLEGKIAVRKPLCNALSNMDLLPINRARIVWDEDYTDISK